MDDQVVDDSKDEKKVLENDENNETKKDNVVTISDSEDDCDEDNKDESKSNVIVEDNLIEKDFNRAEEEFHTLSFPLPPAYYKAYSDEKLKEAAPPPPIPPLNHDTISSFGISYSLDDPILPSLESHGINQLYPQEANRRAELCKLNHSVTVGFLDLVEGLVQGDGEFVQRKIDDLYLLFTNMHHLINEYRIHQSRETVRVILKEQKKSRLELAARFCKQLQDAQHQLQETTENINVLFNDKIGDSFCHQLLVENRSNTRSTSTKRDNFEISPNVSDDIV